MMVWAIVSEVDVGIVLVKLCIPRYKLIMLTPITHGDTHTFPHFSMHVLHVEYFSQYFPLILLTFPLISPFSLSPA